jgi:hypothetical protein
MKKLTVIIIKMVYYDKKKKKTNFVPLIEKKKNLLNDTI